MSANESTTVLEKSESENENDDSEFQKAIAIVSAINSFCFETEIGDQHRADFATLASLTLRQMLDAVAVVVARNDAERENEETKTIYVTPADRLTAAVYTFMNFYPRYPGDDGDELIMRIIQDENETGVNVGFLVRGNRLRTKAEYFGEGGEG